MSFDFDKPFAPQRLKGKGGRPVPPGLPYTDVWFWFDGTNSNCYFESDGKVSSMQDAVPGSPTFFNRDNASFRAVRDGNALLFQDIGGNERYVRLMLMDVLPFNKSLSVYMVTKVEDGYNGAALLQNRTGGANIISLVDVGGTAYKVLATDVDNVGSNQTTNTFNINETAILCLRHDDTGAAGVGSICINGVEGVTWTTKMVTTIDTPWGDSTTTSFRGARIHQVSLTATNKKCWMYEVIIFNRYTTATEHAAIIASLKTKWSIA